VKSLAFDRPFRRLALSRERERDGDWEKASSGSDDAESSDLEGDDEGAERQVLRGARVEENQARLDALCGRGEQHRSATRKTDVREGRAVTPRACLMRRIDEEEQPQLICHHM
jgi:hypothetical protein